MWRDGGGDRGELALVIVGGADIHVKTVCLLLRHRARQTLARHEGSSGSEHSVDVFCPQMILKRSASCPTRNMGARVGSVSALLLWRANAHPRHKLL